MGDMFSKKLSVLEQERQQMRTELAREQNSFQKDFQVRIFVGKGLLNPASCWLLTREKSPLPPQRKENRREYDLSDPAGLKKDLPNRLGDDDPRCGPSSLQRRARPAAPKRAPAPTDAASRAQSARQVRWGGPDYG